jgi:hypothetical protein
MTEDKELFSTEEAARYIDEHLEDQSFSVAALKYHVHVADPPNIEPQLIGHSLVFTREQLDHFIETKRGQGRPPKKAPPEEESDEQQHDI